LNDDVIDKTPQVIEPEDGIEDLKQRLANESAALEAERQARLAAEQQRMDAQRELNESYEREHRAAVSAEISNFELLSTAIEKLNGDTKALEGQLAAAMASGDYEKVAEYQTAIAKNAARLVTMENGKDRLEERLRSLPKEPQKVEPAAPARPADPVEAFASQLTKPSADWIRSHPGCVTDQKMHRKMLAAHQSALADDIKADTPEYFSFIEERLGFTQHQEVDDDPPPAPVAPRRSSPPAAPVSREAPRGDGSKVRRTTMKLTPEQVELAESWGMTPEEYAKHQSDLIAEGRING
jgi:hypothetical protein